MAKMKKPLAKAVKKSVASKTDKKRRKTRRSGSRGAAESGDDLPPVDDDAEYEAAMMDTEKLALEVTRAEEEPGEIDEDEDVKI